MIIEDVAIQHYKVPFRVPFTTSQGLEQYREGLLLRLRTDDGIIGHGEVVSLPSFGTARLAALRESLTILAKRLDRVSALDASRIVDEFASSAELAPVRFAVDTALLDIRSEAAGLSLSQHLSPEAAGSVPLNATISDQSTQGAANVAHYAVTAGYQAVKLKVGIHADPASEVERVAAIRDAIGPDAGLRLDVNGAWSIERAVEIASQIEQYDIDYLEQPLPASDVGAMAQLRKQIGIPIAADEAATTRRAVEELIETDAVDTIIIKPTVVGGISVALELIRLAESAGVRVVVTTALETGVGITAALHLAATLPPPIPACGLATGALLESDLLADSPVIEQGYMKVPDRPGLGVEPIASLWSQSG